VTVASVVSGGPAASAGIQAGDTIAAVGGKAVQTPDDVAAAIQDRRPGDSVSVTVRRGGAEETLQVKLGTRPATTP
jgi:putative serine protease PepD